MLVGMLLYLSIAWDGPATSYTKSYIRVCGRPAGMTRPLLMGRDKRQCRARTRYALDLPLGQELEKGPV